MDARFVTGGLTALLFLGSITGGATGLEEPTPEQIIERMREVYAQCETYRDRGAVETIFFRDGRKSTERKPFTTAFVRSERFRYEFLSRRGEYEFDRYLIWSDWPDVRTWWDVRPGITIKDTLGEALSAAAGVSRGSSYVVPALLMPAGLGRHGLSASPFVGLEELRWLEEGAIEDVACHRIEGTTRGNPVTLWIEQERLLLRRVETQNQFPRFRTEQTTEWEPYIDTPIPPELLVFDPPESVEDR